MRPSIALAAALLLSTAAPAFAQYVVPPPPPASRPADMRAVDDANVDRYCLRETGTRIHRVAKADAQGKCPRGFPGRVYTRDDLLGTGEIDIADALRRLDPSIR